MSKLSLYTFLLMFLAISASAQISFEQQDPVLQKDSSRIMIRYSLTENNVKPGDYYAKYSIKLTYTQDGGATYIGPLKNVRGDVGDDLIAGKDQKIYWYYLAEGNGFDGKNVEFKIDASYEPFLGGPLNALRSAILPGWGNMYVKSLKGWKKWRWVGNTLVVGGLVGAGLYFNQQANNSYQDYLNAVSLDDTQSAYRKASSQRLLSTASFAVAIGFYAYDIVMVALRGTKNKLNKRKVIKQNQERRKNVISFGVNPFSSTPSVGFSWKF